MMRNMAGMMKKVQEMQGRMESMQADLATMEFTAMVGGGAVSATVSGDGKLVRLKLDPAVLTPDDVDMLEDMICLATNNALDGRGPEDLHIDRLVRRAGHDDTAEIILALSATVDGQTTAHYIGEKLANLSLDITRLAHGMPVGGELDYLDDGTLAQALKARAKLEF